MLVEFILPRRPVSHQSKDAGKRQRWKEFVALLARAAWGAQPPIAVPCQLTLVYFCGDVPADIDNIIKPIQDALVSIAYPDDDYVTDVDSHRRPLMTAFDSGRLPPLVLPALAAQQEFVCVRISPAQPLEHYL